MLLITWTITITLLLYMESHYRKPWHQRAVTKQLISISAKAHTFPGSGWMAGICLFQGFTLFARVQIKWSSLRENWGSLGEQTQRQWTKIQMGKEGVVKSQWNVCRRPRRANTAWRLCRETVSSGGLISVTFLHSGSKMFTPYHPTNWHNRHFPIQL